MAPEKMRSEYGKLMYLLQDSASPHVQELLQFSCIMPIKCDADTVVSFALLTPPHQDRILDA